MRVSDVSGATVSPLLPPWSALYTMIPVVSWSKMNPGNTHPSDLEKWSISDDRPHWRCRRRVWEALLVLLLLIVSVSGQRQIIPHIFSTGAEEAGHDLRNPAYLIKAKHGAVASENELCSNIGVEILKEGGNAVDAAVATTFCIGVVNMFS